MLQILWEWSKSEIFFFYLRKLFYPIWIVLYTRSKTQLPMRFLHIVFLWFIKWLWKIDYCKSYWINCFICRYLGKITMVFFNFCFECISFLWKAVWLRQTCCVTAEVRRGLDKTSSCSSYGSSAGSDDLSDPTDYKYSRTRTRPIPILKSQFRPEISPLAREDPLARLREAIGIVWHILGFFWVMD